MKLAVFCSGGGTNLQALAEGIDPRYGQIALVLLSKEGLYAEERAKRLSIPAVVLGKAQAENVDERFRRIDRLLLDNGIEGILLAGYLTVLPRWFTEKWADRIINIHPAWLPRHGGKGCYGMRVHRAVVEEGDTFSGVTVHLVNADVDGGRILAREKYPVTHYDTPETVAAKGHVVEQYIYKHTVNAWLREEAKKEGEQR